MDCSLRVGFDLVAYNGAYEGLEDSFVVLALNASKPRDEWKGLVQDLPTSGVLCQHSGLVGGFMTNESSPTRVQPEDVAECGSFVTEPQTYLTDPLNRLVYIPVRDQHSTGSPLAPVASLRFSAVDKQAVDPDLDSLPVATASVLLAAVPDGPRAISASFTFEEDTRLELVLGSFDPDELTDPTEPKRARNTTVISLPADATLFQPFDPNNPAAIAPCASAPCQAAIVREGTGEGYFDLRPGKHWFGTTTFKFIVQDAEGLHPPSAPATITITVTPLNDPPLATPAAVSLFAGASLLVTLASTDPESDEVVYRLSEIPPRLQLFQRTASGAKGVQLTAGDSVSDAQGRLWLYAELFIPEGLTQDVAYEEKLMFVADDGTAESDAAAVSVNVQVPETPDARSVRLFVLEDNKAVFVFAKRPFETEALTSATVLTLPSRGELFVGEGSDGSYLGEPITAVPFRIDKIESVPLAVVFIAPENESGADYASVNYTVSNFLRVAESPATLTFDVGGVNDVPVPETQRLFTPSQSSINLTVNATDVEGDAITYRLTLLPERGNVFLPDGTLVQSVPFDLPGNTVQYTAAVGSYLATLGFRPSDGDVLSSQEEVVRISVGASNFAPVAYNGSLEVIEDEATLMSLEGFDPEGFPFTALITRLPEHGTLYQLGQGDALGQVFLGPASVRDPLPPQSRVVYVPDPDYSGPDYFGFRVQDNEGLLSDEEGNVSVDVQFVNDAPTPNLSAHQELPEGTAARIVFTGSDDTDAVAVVTALPANVKLYVDRPTLSAQDVASSFAPFSGEPLVPADWTEITANGFVLDDSDPNSGTLRFSLVVVPSPYYNGPLLLRYRLEDLCGPQGLAETCGPSEPGRPVSEVVQLSLKVTGVQSRPTAIAQAVECEEDVPVRITLGATSVDQPYEPEPLPLSTLIVVLPTAGTLFQLAADGSAGAPIAVERTPVQDSLNRIVYVPDPDANGPDSFDYAVTDASSFLESPPETVAVKVSSAPDVPRVQPSATEIAATEDDLLVLTLELFDPDGNDGNSTAGNAAYVLSFTGRGSLYQINAAAVLFGYKDSNALSRSSGTNQMRNAVSLLSLGSGDTLGTQITTFPATVTDAAFRVVFAPEADAFSEPDGPPYASLCYSAGDETTGNIADPDQAGRACLDIWVESSNDAPLALSARYTTLEDEPKVLNLRASDADLDDQSQLRASLVTLPKSGFLHKYQTPDPSNPNSVVGNVILTPVLLDGLKVVYVPAANGFGTDFDSFTFQARDRAGAVSDVASAVIDVLAVNDNPVAKAETFRVADPAYITRAQLGAEALPDPLPTEETDEGVTTSGFASSYVTLKGSDADAGELLFVVEHLPTRGVLYGWVYPTWSTVANNASLLAQEAMVEAAKADAGFLRGDEALVDYQLVAELLQSARAEFDNIAVTAFDRTGLAPEYRALTEPYELLADPELFFDHRGEGARPVPIEVGFRVVDPTSLSGSAIVQLVPNCNPSVVVNIWSRGALCKPCLEGASCSNSGQYLPASLEGFWLSEERGVEDDLQFVECLNAEACQAGTTIDRPQCQEGYEGRLCGQCSEGYYRLKGSCLSCPAEAKKNDKFFWIGLAIVPGILLFAALLLYVKKKGLDLVSECFASNVLVSCSHPLYPDRRPFSVSSSISSRHSLCLRTTGSGGR